MLTILGDWFYPNTDALGLDEYMWWCEDMNMAPLLAVWAGKSYGDILSGPELEPFVEDIMNELEVFNPTQRMSFLDAKCLNAVSSWPVGLQMGQCSREERPRRALEA